MLSDVARLAIEEMRKKSRSRIYQTDPEAWLSDVLGKRWWSRQAEIANDVVGSGSGQTFTLVRSANGVGKTALGADLMTWAVAVHDPLETTVLATANVFSQIKVNAFRYIADNYSYAQAQGIALPGRIVAGDVVVRYDRGSGIMPKDIIQGRRPSDHNLISSFQGTHDGYVFVLLDEAGGLPEDLWIGANAVTTNEHVAVLALGNPDELNTGFHRRFIDTERYSDWTRHTISAFDTPNFTGEILYPEDPERDRAVKSKMIQVSWAEKMKREAHPNVYRAKVLGEFPDSSDSSFFVQSAIDNAYNTEIEPSEELPRVLGVDLSYMGEDKTTFYLNHGGRIRKVHDYNKLDDDLEHARRIDEYAIKLGVDRVHLDANGRGGSCFNLLTNEAFFPNRPYLVVGLLGGRSATDTSRWANARSEHYDVFRAAMQMGEIDLDPDDTELRDQMYAQTFQTNQRRVIQITPKDKLPKSPDHLDAAIYSFYTPPELTGIPAGTVVAMEPEDVEVDYDFYEFIRGPGAPIL